MSGDLADSSSIFCSDDDGTNSSMILISSDDEMARSETTCVGFTSTGSFNTGFSIGLEFSGSGSGVSSFSK